MIRFDNIRLVTAELSTGSKVNPICCVNLFFSGDVVVLELGNECPIDQANVFTATSQTIFELETFATALKFVALKKMPQLPVVRSKDMLIGPTVKLSPAIVCYVDETLFSLSFKHSKANGCDFVILSGQFRDRGTKCRIPVDDALAWADQVYLRAKQGVAGMS